MNELAPEVEKLASIAVAARRGAPAPRRPSLLLSAGFAIKQADMKAVIDTIKNNPPLSYGLVGAGAGALTGGIGQAFMNRNREKGDRRSILGSALTGGLSGAALGFGSGLARTGFANQVTEPSSQLPPGVAAKAQRYLDIQGEPTTPPTETAPGAATGKNSLGKNTALWLRDKTTDVADAGLAGAKTVIPKSLAAAGPLAAWDAIRNSQKLHVGDRPWLSKLFAGGAVRPENSRNFDAFTRGVDYFREEPEKLFKNTANIGNEAKALEAISNSEKLREQLARHRALTPGVADAYRHYGDPGSLQRDTFNTIARKGNELTAELAGGNKPTGMLGNLFGADTKTPRIQRNFLGQDTHMSQGPYRGARLMKRLGIAAALPLAEMIIGGRSARNNEASALGAELQQLLNQPQQR